MTPIVQYLKDSQLPEDKNKARLLYLKVARYILYDGELYRRGFSTPLLKCVNPKKGTTYFKKSIRGSVASILGDSHLPTKPYGRDPSGRP